MVAQAKRVKRHTRTKKFRWEARMALYEHFIAKHGLSQEVVDEQIDSVMQEFKLRKGEVIEPKELWQKVGNELEKKINK